MRFSIQMLCRGGHVRIETRIDGSIHVRFQEKYLAIEECQPQPRQQPPRRARPAVQRRPFQPSEASRQSISGIFHQQSGVADPKRGSRK